MILENWGLCPPNPYSAPEQGLCACGNIYGSPYFNNGEHITTSRIRSGKMEGDTIILTTASGNEYSLGTVSQEYEKQFPNARARVIAQFT